MLSAMLAMKRGLNIWNMSDDEPGSAPKIQHGSSKQKLCYTEVLTGKVAQSSPKSPLQGQCQSTLPICITAGKMRPGTWTSLIACALCTRAASKLALTQAQA